MSPRAFAFLPVAAVLAFLMTVLCAGPGERSASAAPSAQLQGMTQGAVFYDPRLDLVHVKHAERLADWLAANGFEKLRSEGLARWMASRIEQGAYGSVVVMTMGMAPGTINDRPGKDTMWYRYLNAGGRIVWLGDLPFNYTQQVDAGPNPAGLPRYGLLGLKGGWNQPYWGQNMPVTRTKAAEQWGIEHVDGSVTGFAVEDVTIAFGTYEVATTGKTGATSWMVRVNPDYEWSGLIKMMQSYDGRINWVLADVWRAAHYVGHKVKVPKMPPAYQAPAAPPMDVNMSASGIEGRTVFERGESVRVAVRAEKVPDATTFRVELLQDDRALTRKDAAAEKDENGVPAAALSLDTAPYDFGDYVLRVSALRPDGSSESVAEQFLIRHVPQKDFCWHIGMGIPENPYRADILLDDLRQHGMEPHTPSVSPKAMDTILKHDMGFSVRLHRRWETEKPYYRYGIDRKVMLNKAYGGGRPMLGISHPEVRQSHKKLMRDGFAAFANHPAVRPYILTNDDFSIYYGWDFAPHVLKQFKEQTGLDAPTEKVKPPLGIVDPNNAWLQWCLFTLKEVCGAFNQAQKEAVVSVRKDARIGPIPGGMQIPLIQMWTASQYPPLNFGEHGHNLIAFYYYNTYWQPVLTNTFWVEIGRMANRNLPEWVMPDIFMTAGYFRNNLFHLLAGGADGLAYFSHDSRNPETWQEAKHLAPQVARIGPVQARLGPARRRIGLLHSITTNCFNEAYDLVLVYAYENLVQGHFDVEMVCEEEIMAGRAARYDAILLYDVLWLTPGVYGALEDYAAKGGLLLLDTTIPFDIAGARRLNVDLGMGKQKTKGVPPEGAHVSTPGVRDYGRPDRIRIIAQEVSKYVPPLFRCSDIRLVAHTFQVGQVPYIWLVNAHTGEEYMFLRSLQGAGHPGAGTPEKIAELKEWEKEEMAKGDFSAEAAFERLPGVPYDLLRGRRLKVTGEGGLQRIAPAMERFGGTLVAFYPEPIESVAVEAPRQAGRMEEVTFRITVRGASGPIPGAVPLKVSLLKPSGEEHVTSGHFATDGGEFNFKWRPATNAPAGAWTLKVTELASGKRASARITLP